MLSIFLSLSIDISFDKSETFLQKYWIIFVLFSELLTKFNLSLIILKIVIFNLFLLISPSNFQFSSSLIKVENKSNSI